MIRKYLFYLNERKVKVICVESHKTLRQAKLDGTGGGGGASTIQRRPIKILLLLKV